MNTQNMSKNLQYTRRRLKLSQRQFVDSFLTSESGRALCSVPKLSNLENKGGKNLDVVCDILAGRLGLKGQDFSLGQTEFSGKLEEKLSQPEISSDRDLDDIVQEAARNSRRLYPDSQRLSDGSIAGREASSRGQDPFREGAQLKVSRVQEHGQGDLKGP